MKMTSLTYETVFLQKFIRRILQVLLLVWSLNVQKVKQALFDWSLWEKCLAEQTFCETLIRKMLARLNTSQPAKSRSKRCSIKTLNGIIYWKNIRIFTVIAMIFIINLAMPWELWFGPVNWITERKYALNNL